jgi:hypothetical protein
VFERRETITVDHAVDGVKVAAVPASLAAWMIAIKNTTSDSMLVVWDESSFVGSSGRAHGRLVRGVTRKVDTAKAQPPSPLPPGATVTELVLPEDFLGQVELEDKVVYETPDVALRRAQVLKELDGGHLYVALQTASGKESWSGITKEDGRAPPSRDARRPASTADPNDDPRRASAFWCSAVDGHCSADSDRCREPCGVTRSVWCAVREDSHPPSFVCGTTREVCQLRVARMRDPFGECIPRTAGE